MKGDAVLRSLTIRNFTVFEETDLRFVRGLNVTLGARGKSQTHLREFPNALRATRTEEGRKRTECPANAARRRCFVRQRDGNEIRTSRANRAECIVSI